MGCPVNAFPCCQSRLDARAMLDSRRSAASWFETEDERSVRKVPAVELDAESGPLRYRLSVSPDVRQLARNCGGPS
jgi:hypothetical protein